ncbi:unnamed protein product [Protopolystoma xenopodis]|uniref:Uncharacterized protein n=1 Tax=Protopolystoma xenopodis TaxID=117903 RepID=A0A448X8M6_9PLAT|nr:unnamed protein product [Protopolystoma xenopodis]
MGLSYNCWCWAADLMGRLLGPHAFDAMVSAKSGRNEVICRLSAWHRHHLRGHHPPRQRATQIGWQTTLHVVLFRSNLETDRPADACRGAAGNSFSEWDVTCGRPTLSDWCRSVPPSRSRRSGEKFRRSGWHSRRTTATGKHSGGDATVDEVD